MSAGRILSNAAIESGKGAVGGAMSLLGKLPIIAAGDATKASAKRVASLLGDEGRAVTKGMLEAADTGSKNLSGALTDMAASSGSDVASLKKALKSGDMSGTSLGSGDQAKLQSLFDKSQELDAIASERMTEQMGAPLDMAKTYFMGEGTKAQRGSITTAAGRIGAVAVGARVLGGGTLTKNNRGERDIVGVPFI